MLIHRDATWQTVLDGMAREYLKSETLDTACPAGFVLKTLCEQVATHMNNAYEATERMQSDLQYSLDRGQFTSNFAQNSHVRRRDEAMTALEALNTPLMAAAMAYCQARTLGQVNEKTAEAAVATA